MAGAEAEIATVATLSQDLLEALREDQNDLKCPMDVISGSDNEIPLSMSLENIGPQSNDTPRSMSVSTTYDDFSNVATIPDPPVSSHKLSPDLDSPTGSSIDPSQSSSHMFVPASSLIEPTYLSTSCVILHLVTEHHRLTLSV
jgi:hypothetical protein